MLAIKNGRMADDAHQPATRLSLNDFDHSGLLLFLLKFNKFHFDQFVGIERIVNRADQTAA
jgi:hypothetical protein